jgi:hypothetical protein
VVGQGRAGAARGHQGDDEPERDPLRRAATPRVDALCARRPLYPGFRGFTSYA